MLNNWMLVDYCKEVHADGWVYWYGSCGYECSTALYNRKKTQYPSQYTDDRKSGYMKDISDGKTCADCVGMIKSFFWKGGDIDGRNVYKSNNCGDVSANGMFALCKTKGPIGTMPDIPGLVVHKDGHIGVYVGDGYTIEMRGFAYDCVKRKVSEGPWTEWVKLPETMLEYTPSRGSSAGGQTGAPAVLSLGDRTLKKGCVGDDVKALQIALLNLDYDLPKYGADGDYGGETVKAVQRFQTDRGLDATGVFDTDDFKALTDALNPPETQDEDTDTPADGGAPAWLLIIGGDEERLKAAQAVYGGKLVMTDDVMVFDA